MTSRPPAYLRLEAGQPGLSGQPGPQTRAAGLQLAVTGQEAEQVVVFTLAALALGAPLPAKAREEMVSRLASRILDMGLGVEVKEERVNVQRVRSQGAQNLAVGL